MVATLVIGLREGLEAALIVSIIAAFLRKNSRPLTAMWVGVALAVALSGAVGAVLAIVEQSLPQSGQEGMEAVIGAVAIFFVTGMVLWMNTHARAMKADLEAEAAAALGDGRSQALAVMAFLAVLKEGFETSVFLLATFSAAQSATDAAIGAVVGVLLAVVIGCGIYFGGVRINLSRFFRITGAFLILVAAGLVMTTLRSAHEAGWLNAGQQMTVNLTGLVRPGSVQSALITGVLGIQPDPRLVEVVGWFTYLIPVALVVYWPVRRRPAARTAGRVRLGIGAALVAGAAVLAFTVPSGRAPSRTAPITAAAGHGTARLLGATAGAPQALTVTTPGGAATTTRVALGVRPTSVYRDGVAADQWRVTRAGATAGSATVSLDRLVAVNGGRVPVGFDVGQDRGPFHAHRTAYRTTIVWAAGGGLLDASQTTATVLTLSGGGLSGSRTITLGSGPHWRVVPSHVRRTVASLTTRATDDIDHRFWAIELPIGMVLIALILVGQTLRPRRVEFVDTTSDLGPGGAPSIGPGGPASPPRSNRHAVH